MQSSTVMPELASHVKSSGSRKLNISRPIWIRCAMRRSEMQMTPPEYHCTTRRPTIMQSSTVMPELASHVKSSGSRKLNISRPIWIRCALRRSEMQMTPPEYHCTTRRPTIMQSSTVMPELASHVKSSGSRKLNISRPIWIRCALRRSEMQMTPPEYHCTTRRPTIMQSSTVMPELASHVKSSCSRKLNISRPIWIRCAMRRSEMQMTPPEYHCTTRRPTIMQSSTVMPELASHVKSSGSRKLNISRPIWIRCAMRRSEMQMTPPEYHCSTRRPTIMQSSTVMPELASHVKSSGSRKLNISRPIWIRCAMRRSEMQMTPPEYHCTTRPPTIMQSSTVMPELASHVKSSGSRKLNISRPIRIRCAMRRSEMQMTPPEYHCTTRRPTIVQSSTVMPELASHVKSSGSRKFNISRPIWIR